MKLLKTIILLVLAILIGGNTPTFSQSPEQIYQKGLMKEEGEGSLLAAIDLYEQIANNSSADHSLQAKALLHIGMCYEKMGMQEAIKAYQRLVNNFPRQKNEVAIARERLSRLILMAEKIIQKETTRDIMIRKVMDGTGSEFYGAPSPDANYFAFVDYKTDPYDIVITNIKTKKEVRLRNQTDLNHNGDEGIPYNPIWSPDSKQIAYVWENEKDNLYNFLLLILTTRNQIFF